MRKTAAQLAAIGIAAALAGAAAPAAAQPARLRMANSLCASATSALAANQLVPPLASSADAGAPVNGQLMARAAQQRDAYFARLDGISPFSGLYAAAGADHGVASSQSRYSVGLEWELFNQGREDAKRQLERARIDSKAQYLQLMRDAESRELQEKLLAISQMRNRLLATLYQREAAAVAPVLERRRRALAAGRATRAEVAELEFRVERAALRSRHYAGTADVLVYPQVHELINRIETLALRPEGELAELAVSRSSEFQMHALLAGRADLFPATKDNLSVRLYAERAKEFESSAHNVAGVRVRIPLGDDKGRSEAVAAARGVHLDQQDSIRAELRQRLALLSEQLRLKQTEMRLLQSESGLLRQKADLACYRMDYPVAGLAGDPDREVEEFTLLLHEKQREILSARLDVLEALTQLSALVKPQRPEELYSLISP